MATTLSPSSTSTTLPSSSSSSTSTPVIHVSIQQDNKEVANVQIHKNLLLPSPIEIIDDTPYSYHYTGRHDGGILPPIPTHNIYGHILEAIKEAKVSVDKEIQKILPPPSTISTPQEATKTLRKDKGKGPKQKVCRYIMKYLKL